MLTRALAAVGGLAVLSLPLLALSYPYGAPAGFDGFENNCQQCHSSFALNSGSGSVAIETSLGEGEGYAAGEPVTLTVTVDNTTEPAAGGSGRVNGFVLAVRDADGDPVGEYDLGGASDVRFTQNDTDYVTHTTAGNEQDSWSFDWIPPAEMTPEAVTVYVSANAANGNGALSGDYVYTAQLPLAIASSGEERPDDGALTLGDVFPQPARDRAAATVTLREAGEVSARLVDGRGRTVRTLAGGLRPAGETPLALDLRGLEAGTYFVVVETEGGRRTGRVVVVR